MSKTSAFGSRTACFPAKRFVTEMWKASPTRVLFRCKVKERDSIVISNATLELYEEIPQPAAKPAPKAASAASAASSA